MFILKSFEKPSISICRLFKCTFDEFLGKGALLSHRVRFILEFTGLLGHYIGHLVNELSDRAYLHTVLINAVADGLFKVSILLLQANDIELDLLTDVYGAEHLWFEQIVNRVSHFLRQEAIALNVDFKFFLHLILIQFLCLMIIVNSL